MNTKKQEIKVLDITDYPDYTEVEHDRLETEDWWAISMLINKLNEVIAAVNKLRKG